MKQAKKILVSFMTLALILTTMVMAVFADEGNNKPHFSATASVETVKVGDEFTVAVSSSEMTISSVYGGIVFDSSKVEVKDVKVTNLTEKDGTRTLSIGQGAGADSNVGFTGTGTDKNVTYAANASLMTVTFEAKAAGTAEFALYEDVDGTDEYYADIKDAYGKISVTIQGETPADPEVITLISRDGTTIALKVSDIKSATKEDGPFKLKGEDVAGPFYSVKSILQTKGVDLGDAHGLKVTASDGAAVGFSAEDLDNLYLYDTGNNTFRSAMSDPNAPGYTWVKGVTTIAPTNDHVWTFKKGACAHECSICNMEEPSILINGAKVYDCEIKAATKVDGPFQLNGTDVTGPFYSVKSILQKKGVDLGDAHGLKVTASDGAAVGFSAEDLDNLYVYVMDAKAGTYRTAMSDPKAPGYTWVKEVTSMDPTNDHVWTFKKGACTHTCSICEAEEPSILINGAKVYDCEIKAATKVDGPFQLNGTDVTGPFYSVKSILQKKGVDLGDAHGLKVTASDGAAVGFSAEDLDNLYVYVMDAKAGTYRTAMSDPKAPGYTWVKEVTSMDPTNDHVWTFKKGECTHTCSICDAKEPGADYSAVNTAKTNAAAIDSAIYTTDSYAALTEAVAAVSEGKYACQQADVDAMAKAINDAIDALEKKPADYTEVDKAKAAAEALNRDLYTEKTLKKVDDAVKAIVEGKKIDEQTAVDAMATAINDAITGLEKKPADYTEVDKAKKAAEALDKNIYTEETMKKVDDAVDAIVEGKKIDEQADVDAMAKAINDAIGALEKYPADYTAVEEAKKAAEALDKSLYTEESMKKVDDAVKAVVEGKKIDEQKDVDAMAKAINDAVTNAVLKETMGEKTYEFKSGSDDSWTGGSSKAMEVAAKASYDDSFTINHFNGIEVDGKAVPEKDASGKANYIAKAGSVIIDLQPDYLKTLSVGEHKLTVMFDDAEPIETSFTIKEAPDTSIKTGDTNQITLWIIVMVLALAGGTASVILLRKKANK